jgi:pimeloyl-ACP methyl ester carboxylesterase
MLEGGVVRVDLRFPCGEDSCAGWLYRPPGVAEPPVVVMGHGFSGTRDVALPAFAEAFARAGLAAFTFDYRCFGASGGAPRQLIDPWMQLEDWRAALAFVRGRGDVDGERLAVWGTSMGGGLAVVIGAEQPRPAAIVAQVPALDTDIEPEGPQLSLSWGLRLLFTAWADLVQSLWSNDAILIHAFAPPGEFGMIVDDVSYAEIGKLVPADGNHENRMAARSILTFDEYNPASSWAQVQSPTLIVATREDRLAPFAAVEAFASANENVTVETFEGSHFDVYVPPILSEAARIEIQFLREALGASE